VRIALAQINPTIGDFDGNRRLVLEATAEAARRAVELVVFPELTLSGYPPKDLLERPGFIDAAAQSLQALAAALGGCPTAVLVGFPEKLPPGSAGRGVANSAALIEDGRVTHVARKSLLPTYDVFDEWRYFEPAASVAPIPFRGRRLGVSICEDIWNDADFWPQRLYRADPIEALVAAGAEVIVNVSASPYTMEKRHLRPRMLAATARRWQRPLLFVNQVGGQDDLIFDGASLALTATGQVVARGAENAVDLVVADLDTGEGTIAPFDASDERSALAALALGTRDYARRCGFSQALLGLSGGIDSALVACIAARALGPDRVLGVAMPSRYSSPSSLADAEALARNLGIDFTVIPIEPMLSSYLDALAPALDAFAPAAPAPVAAAAADLTQQNLQARIRGALLMALSNRQGRLLLTTGNKSEVATGYCTLYGDMAGGLAVISDAPKTLVYRLSRAVNAERPERPLIPESTLTKAPSAELRPDQTDQDELPPYELLDQILEAHVVGGLDVPALVARGFDAAVVKDVVRRVRISEYKRRQMPPGLKITGKAFGPGRRYPIARAGD
jgi:NAD+ synthase (glutamine-hydrolysing)